MSTTFLWLWLLGAPLLLAFFDLPRTRSGQPRTPNTAVRSNRY